MYWHFGPFRLDLAHACLWYAAQPAILRPKTFEVGADECEAGGRRHDADTLGPSRIMRHGS